MAYKMSDVNSWGTGALGTVTNPSGTINSYANVTAISGSTVTIGTAAAGIYEAFTVGAEVVLHVSVITTGTDLQYLGNYIFAKITAVNGSVLTLDKDVSTLVGSSVFANHHVQIATVAQFDTLNLTAAITPPAYSVTNKYGGIVAFKCKTAYNYSGSAAINTVAKGIPIANVAYRPATAQEGTAAQIGWENHITSRKLYMNCPDGIVFIAAKASNGSGTAARFGGTTAGVARYPYNDDNTTNAAIVGGPTIMWLSETMTGFDPSVISKTSSNTSGKGLARCYIATESNLPSDEGLYSLDCLSNPARLAAMGIKDFGTGSIGSTVNLSGQVNSYAPVVGISTDGHTINIGSISQGAYETFVPGARIILHVSKQTGTDNACFGKFIQSTILSVSGSDIVIDTPVTNIIPANITSNYKCQVITVCQFDTIALSANYSGTKAYDDTVGCGGILVLAAKSLFDLQNGQLDVSGKGLPASRGYIPWQCSGHQSDCVPLSGGNGAIIILSKKITLNASSRIGSTWVSGANYGGPGYGAGSKTGSIFKGGDMYSTSDNSTGGLVGCHGGYLFGIPSYGGIAGASLFIVADEIVNFTIGAITTGGSGSYDNAVSGAGGAGFGGGGRVGMGAGAGPGTCFIYCNTVTNPDYTAYQAS